MKKHLLTFLMGFLLFSIPAMNAEEKTVTITAESQGWTNALDLSNKTIDNDNFTISFSKNNGSNPPKYYTSNKTARLYANSSGKNGNSFTITPKTGVTLKSVSYLASSQNNNVTISNNNATFTNSTVKTIEIKSWTITVETGGTQTGPVTPNVTFEDLTLEMGETAMAGSWPSDLTTISFAPVTDGIITIANDGTITPVAVGETQVNVSWTEVTDKYTAGSTSFNVTVIPKGEDKIYELVTDASEIVDGGKYILVGHNDTKNKDYGMADQGEKIRNTAEVTVTNNRVTITSKSKVAPITLVADDKGYYLQVSDGYLQGPASNNVNTITNKSEATVFTIAKQNTGNKFDISYVTGSDTRYLQFNASSDRFACYKSSSNQQSCLLFKLVEAEPEPTVVTLTWGEADQEYTVGQEGVAISLTVEPNTQEAKNVVKISSSDETKVKATYFGGDNEVALTFLDAAENVTLTAEIVDNRNEYKGDPKTISFKVNAKPVEVVEPEQVVSTPAAENDVINVRQGATITFSSENAAKLKVESINGESSNIVNNPYTYTANELDILTVTPIDAAGTEYTDMQLVVEINVEVAPAITANTTATFNFVESECYHPNYDSGAQGVQNTFYFISEDPGMFGAMFNVASGYGGSFEYVAGQGWKFIKGDASECNYFIHFTMQEAFSNCNYFINGIKLNTNSNDADTPTFKIEDTVNNPGSFNGNVWTGNSTTNYVTVEIHSTADFILNSIDVTFEHPEVEKPYAVFAAENIKDKFILKHNKADHKIYYRVTEGAAQAAYRAADNSDFTEFTAGTQIPLNNTQVLHFYAKHPHGMMSEVTSMTRDELIATGVEGIVTDEADVQWFNMQGVRVSEPTEGVYIRVQNGKAAKVVK